MADARGKRLSPDAPVPYEAEALDTHAVLDWIVKQPWSDGKVGMIGGSYSGFTAWAATKRRHPALKGIAVSAAAIPGLGLPMHNNVFLSANYQWAFYVTNNKLLDDAVNDDGQRWWKMQREWFMSGRPYREIDAVDGTPNPWLQRWLQHPAYDKYWQSMVPYESDFARINIPVLTITGYYDDGADLRAPVHEAASRSRPKPRALPGHRPLRSPRHACAQETRSAARVHHRPGGADRFAGAETRVHGLRAQGQAETGIAQGQDQL